MSRKKNKKNYSEEFKANIVNSVLAGQAAVKISRKFDVSTGAIYNWINQHKQKIKANNHLISQFEATEVSGETKVDLITKINNLTLQNEQLIKAQEDFNQERKQFLKDQKEYLKQLEILKQAALILAQKKK